MSWIENRRIEVEGKAEEYLRGKGFEIERYVKYNTIKLPSGYEMTTPAEEQPYQIIATKNGMAIKVCVKIAQRGRKSQPNNWKIVTYTAKEPPDVYLVWIYSQERFIELPGSFFKGCTGTVRTVPLEIVSKWEGKR